MPKWPMATWATAIIIKTAIGSVNVDITDVHPSTQIDETHFVIEIYPIRLKWTM